MKSSLLRKEFLDIHWDREDLDALSDLWFAWHEKARGRFQRNLETYHSIKVRLWGFPREEGESLCRRLSENLRDTLPFETEMDLSDPDWLCASAPFLDSSFSCSIGMWLGPLNDPAFHGLMVIVRLNVRDWTGLPVGPAKAGGTLVICGQIQQNRLLVKAIWPEGLKSEIAKLYRNTVWLGESQLLEDFDHYRRTGAIHPPQRDMFTTRESESEGNRITRLLIVPEDSRLLGFCWRIGLLSALLALTAFFCFLELSYIGMPLLAAFLLVHTLSGLLFLFGLVFVVRTEIWRVAFLYSNTKRNLRRAFADPFRWEEVNASAKGLLGDPSCNKYSRELESLGCEHIVDVRLITGSSATICTRIFAIPAERMYIFLSLMTSTGSFREFPAKTSFLLTTYLSDGRIMTLTQGGGFRKHYKPTNFARCLPSVHDPEILIAKHRKFVAEKREVGHKFAPYFGTQELLKRMAKDHEESRELYERYGYYTWSQAFRQNFKLVRREFLEPDEE
jgi:hypothetical protein